MSARETRAVGASVFPYAPNSGTGTYNSRSSDDSTMTTNAYIEENFVREVTSRTEKGENPDSPNSSYLDGGYL